MCSFVAAIEVHFAVPGSELGRGKILTSAPSPRCDQIHAASRARIGV
jgi:hypothetical protein